MTVLAVVLAIYVAGSLLYWLRTLQGVVRLRRHVPFLAALAPADPPVWPRLSVVVPARNEAEEIEAAVRTLLEDDYPDLEIVLVDDRSTDGTGEIIDRLAAGDDRVRTRHVTDLPEGWLGKVHALDRGQADATGDFVLFTDADVHFRRGALRKAVAYCEAEGIDHLAALPTLRPGGILVGAVIASFIRQFLTAVRPWAVRNPRSRAYMGIGAFNLVRRSALEATPGFEWLRLEMGDDMGLGLMMKESGARCAVVAAFGLVALHWYRTLGEAARGAEKAYASAGQCRFPRMLVVAGLYTALEVAPLVSLVPLLWADLRFVGYGGLVVLGAFAASAVLLSRWAGARVFPALLGPLVAPLNAGAFVRAGLLGWWRGSVTWRGQAYPVETLRGQGRIRFP